MTAYLAAFAELFWALALVAGILFAGMLFVALVKQAAYNQDRKQARRFRDLNQPDRSYWT